MDGNDYECRYKAWIQCPNCGMKFEIFGSDLRECEKKSKKFQCYNCGTEIKKYHKEENESYNDENYKIILGRPEAKKCKKDI